MHDVRLIEANEIADWSWSRLSRAADDATDAMRLVTLATVTPEGRPSARMMVLRGAERSPTSGGAGGGPSVEVGGSGRVWFHTHANDGKVADLSLNPAATVVAWDVGAQVQLRVSGFAIVHRLDAVAQMHFDQGSTLRARLAPSIESGAQETLPDLLWPGASEELVHAITRKAWRQFAVIELNVGIIESIQSSGAGSRRFVMRAAQEWHATE